MPDNNYNIIKPVEGLQSLTGINPVGERRHRQQKQYPGGQGDSGEPEADDTHQDQDDAANDKSSRHGIDFKA